MDAPIPEVPSATSSGPPAKRSRQTTAPHPSAAMQALRATSVTLSAMGVKWTAPRVSRFLANTGARGRHPGAIAPRRIPTAAWLPHSHPSLLAILNMWGAELFECGATSRDERGQPVHNQCFYLSLAAATAPAEGAIATTAYAFKRRIEAAVLLSRGANYPLEADEGAFADFLEDGMSSVGALHSRAVAVAEATTGGVTLYSVPGALDATAPVILLWYTPGHYQLIRWNPPAGQSMPRPGPFGQSLSHTPGPRPRPGPVPHTLVDARPPALVDLT